MRDFEPESIRRLCERPVGVEPWSAPSGRSARELGSVSDSAVSADYQYFFVTHPRRPGEAMPPRVSHSGACAATESMISRSKRFEPRSRSLGSSDAPWPGRRLLQSVGQPQGVPADWRSSWPRRGIAVSTLDLQDHHIGGSFTQGATPSLPRPMIVAGRFRVSRTGNRTWRRACHPRTSGLAQALHGSGSLAIGALEDD